MQKSSRRLPSLLPAKHVVRRRNASVDIPEPSFTGKGSKFIKQCPTTFSGLRAAA